LKGVDIVNHFVWQVRFLRFIVFGVIFSLFGLAGLGIPLVWHGIMKIYYSNDLVAVFY